MHAFQRKSGRLKQCIATAALMYNKSARYYKENLSNLISSPPLAGCQSGKFNSEESGRAATAFELVGLGTRQGGWFRGARKEQANVFACKTGPSPIQGMNPSREFTMNKKAPALLRRLF
ncbi:hypothetical protein SPV1_03508 [Mariprofundus ferrooxydans PV-1]|uniref:Uncharacterized protein n=1 Tax=Mariprofundus ferrooxydans PV-1 TaxID=314345 RepID=Q0F3T9_9PROT|nr:hypothetical protein SPV1_03508 [Mariprofundus ferrooxydans PV-1]